MISPQWQHTTTTTTTTNNLIISDIPNRDSHDKHGHDRNKPRNAYPDSEPKRLSTWTRVTDTKKDDHPTVLQAPLGAPERSWTVVIFGGPDADRSEYE